MAGSDVGLVAPGAMGAAMAEAIVAPNVTVRWASHQRSDATRRRAERAGLVDVGTVTALARASDVLLSVCPPGSARAVADQIADCGFDGVYVDANAIAPATSRRIAKAVAPARFVDGGLIGPPPRQAGTTRLYLAGADASDVAALFAGGPLEAVVLDGHEAAASALKACFASFGKGRTALLLTVRALADAEGVDDALIAEWQRSQPELPSESERAASQVAPKAWRFVDELREHATAFADAALPRGFGEAAAEAYSRMADLRDAGEEVSSAAVVRRLRGLDGEGPGRSG